MADVLPFRRPAPTDDPQKTATQKTASAAKPADLPDDVLVERAREGADWARAALFTRHAPAVLALLTRLLASTSDAEDAVQDAFVEALRDLADLRHAGDFERWLRRIAIHQAHRRFRRRRLLSALGFDGTPLDATLDLLADERATTDTRAELALAQKVLAKLPATERAAWVLRHVEGLELTEVADALDVSLATVKRKLAAAQAAIATVTGWSEGRAP